nr:hypothetical protein [Tanacetum cinerariifolium]
RQRPAQRGGYQPHARRPHRLGRVRGPHGARPAGQAHPRRYHPLRAAAGHHGGRIARCLRADCRRSYAPGRASGRAASHRASRCPRFGTDRHRYYYPTRRTCQNGSHCYPGRCSAAGSAKPAPGPKTAFAFPAGNGQARRAAGQAVGSQASAAAAHRGRR